MFVIVAYHMSWPGTDPYYNWNSADANTRRAFYNVTGIPDAAIDGNSVYPGSPTGWNTINAAAQVAPTVSIDVTGVFDEEARSGEITIGVTPEGATVGPATLHAVIVENDLYYMGSNGQPDHEFVMRDMLPTASGTSISLLTGSTVMTDLGFTVHEDIVLENAMLVVFVQNPSNKDIHNAYAVPLTNILEECLNETGDIIDFGAINVQDLVKLVGIIMGTDTDSDYCQLAAADINSDGQVNIQDVILLVEVILG